MSQAAAETPTVDHLPAAMRQALLERVEKEQLDLPVLPEVASQVISACSNVDCDLRKLTALIGRDQSMTTHLLRISNSALYATNVQIVSLQQALSRLGLKKIREIALIISCQARVFRVDGFDLVVRALFRHSLAAAAFAQEIARMRRWSVEEAFLCGLLHDVGRPVLLQTLVDIKKELKIDVEREVLVGAADAHHAHVGSKLIGAWELPERVGEAVLFHHEPHAAPTSTQAAMMTRFADDLAHFALGTHAIPEEEIRQHPMLAPLNFYPEELEGLLAKKDDIATLSKAVA